MGMNKKEMEIFQLKFMLEEKSIEVSWPWCHDPVLMKETLISIIIIF